MNHLRACPQCLRRSWLLELLGPYVERIYRPGADLAQLLRLDDQRLAQAAAPQVADQLLARVAALRESELVAAIESADCWATCRHDERFPANLREAAASPAALIGRGDPDCLTALDADPTATVVGSRRATSYGREVARELGRELAAAGIAVISGLAFGIDSCAHRGALDAGRTIAVLGCGPDVAYPASHRSLWRRIIEAGAVISELPPGAGPWRWTFPARNRIMAALAEITVVVEAAHRSGSLTTAHSALGLGRRVGAVPGPVSSRASGGTNELLAQGALVIRDAQDVLSVLPRSQPRSITAAEPAYTVIAVPEFASDTARFAETFFTFDGPKAAEALAREWARDQGKGEIQIAAVLPGEVEPLA